MKRLTLGAIETRIKLRLRRKEGGGGIGDREGGRPGTIDILGKTYLTTDKDGGWRKANGRQPLTIIHYREGCSVAKD